MKALLACLLTASILSSPAIARGPASSERRASTQGTAVLKAGLSAVMKAAAAASGRPADRDQGDEHASAIALDRVCNKNTPAAQRSAICNNLSPE